MGSGLYYNPLILFILIVNRGPVLFLPRSEMEKGGAFFPSSREKGDVPPTEA
jgi:hypothetical protein